MSTVIHLNEREWTYSDSEGFIHGQHIKMYGSMGYVNYRLINKDTFKAIQSAQTRKENNNG